MIVNTKTGIAVSGPLVCTPELRQAGSRMVLKLCVRYGWELSAEPGGKRAGKLLDVDVWDNAETLDGMFEKGDFVTAYGDEIKTREYNGKTYRSIDAAGLVPDAAVVFRWLQQVVDMIPAAPAAPTETFCETDEATPFDPQNARQGGPQAAQGEQQSLFDGGAGAMYPGERLNDYAPGRRPPFDPALGEPPILADDEDLPF